jgi:hypothetical protein
MNATSPPPNESAAPPAWAQSLLRLLLTPAKEAGVAGDLLEEYHEAVMPERGTLRADAWYIRQVAGFLWRMAGPIGALVAAQVLARDLLDTFAPPADYHLRSALSTYGAVATYLIAGLYGGYRTGRARTGTLVAAVSHAFGQAVSIAVFAVIFFVLVRKQPSMLIEFERTGGWGEGLGLPVVLFPFVVILGTVGGVVGKHLGRMPRRRRVAG